jgi:CubicO group peptidase (beta-lactamase class C family)
LIDAIIKSPLGARGHYLYSDLGFYLLARLVERVTHKPFEIYLEETFYRPMGLTTLGFKPLSRIAAGRIIPTENDTLFRRQLLRGDVHDQGAALMGGVSGHAGLFSDGFDCAVILQMLLNYGEYGMKQYLMPSTIKEFTRVQFPENENRRAMGFDKPPAHGSIDGPACPSASAESYGHSGFTGTYVWADPDYKLAYVFLSNRINPSASNNKLSELNIRTRIHEAMYQILKKQQEN